MAGGARIADMLFEIYRCEDELAGMVELASNIYLSFFIDARRSKRSSHHIYGVYDVLSPCTSLSENETKNGAVRE